MDFAEFSDIETMGFTTYRQKLQEQFSTDVEQEIVEAHVKNYTAASSFVYYAKEIIPVFSNVVNLGNAIIDVKRLDKKELPNEVSKDILSRISAKFNQTLDHVGKYVEVIQGKLTAAEEGIKIRQDTIDQLHEAFLSDQFPPVLNKDLEIRRLRHRITLLTTKNKILDNSTKHLKKTLLEIRAERIKAVSSITNSKINELHDIIEQLNKRNLELGKRFIEKEKEAEDDKFTYTLTRGSIWIADKIARAVGLGDVAIFVKNFVLVAEAAFRGIVVLGYVYTLYNTTDHYLYWLKNGWKDKMSRLYALSILPFMLFCMVKLAGY